MKKLLFILTVFFAFFVISGTSPADDSGAYRTALEKYHSGRYQEAVVFLKAYVEKKPDPAAYYLIGYALYKLKRYDESTDYFKDAYLIDPTFSPEKADLFQGFSKKEIDKMKKASRRHKVKKHKKTPAAMKGGTSDASGNDPSADKPGKD